MKKETLDNAIMYLEQLEMMYEKTKKERNTPKKAKQGVEMLLVGLRSTIKEIKEEL